jgi:hypothetical protein
VGDSVVQNVGGSVLQGHRDGDNEIARFLDGERENTRLVQLRADFEPITDLFLTGVAEWRSTEDVFASSTRNDIGLSIQVRLEY